VIKLDSWNPREHALLVRHASVLAWSPHDDFVVVQRSNSSGTIKLVPLPRKGPDDLVGAQGSR